MSAKTTITTVSAGEHHEQRAGDATVGGAAAEQVADEQADAEEHEQPRHASPEAKPLTSVSV